MQHIRPITLYEKAVLMHSKKFIFKYSSTFSIYAKSSIIGQDARWCAASKTTGPLRLAYDSERKLNAPVVWSDKCENMTHSVKLILMFRRRIVTTGLLTLYNYLTFNVSINF